MAYITNYSGNTVISGTAYDDTIGVYRDYVTIEANRGNDSIYFHSGNFRVANAGSGNDSINADYTSFSTLDGGSGNDTLDRIGNNGDYIYALGGEGDDTFYLSGGHVTITGGGGADVISPKGTVLVTDISSEDIIASTLTSASPNYLSYSKNSSGYIVLQDNGPTTFTMTLQGITDINQVANVKYRTPMSTKTLGEIFSGNQDDDEISTAGRYFINAYGDTVISCTTGNDTVAVYRDNVTVEAYRGDDIIYFHDGNFRVVYGDYGNDSINAGWTNFSSIYGGAGNDTINNIGSYGDYIYVDGGDGDDILQTSGSYVTLTGGNGADVFIPSGNMTITDLSNNDIIRDNSTTADPDYLTYSTDSNGNIILKDEDPTTFTMTLKGITNISQVSGVKYVTPKITKTLGEIFGTSGGGGSQDTSSGGGSGNTSGRYIMYGGESNTNANFTSGMAANSSIAVLYNGFSKAYRNGYNVYFEMPNSNRLTLLTDTNSSDDAIMYSGDGSKIYVAKIADGSATNITYFEGIDYYGLAQFGTLNLKNGMQDGNAHDIRLDGSNGISYLYIANVNAAGSSGNDYLAGNSGSNSIIAGSGETTLWGGNGGDDTLVGGSAKDYFRFTGEGNDVVVDFTSGMANNSDAAILPENFTVSRSNNILTFNAPNGNKMTVNTDSYSGDDAILYSGDGQTFYSAKIADSTATNITYYENIQYYGLAQFGTLNLQNGTHDTNAHDIRLDGSNGVSYLYIANINAAGSSGNDTLYGNAGSNEIIAGSGNSTLWGGQYDNTADILIGGSGVDMFMVGKNDGNDVIQNSAQNDVINLYDISLSEISANTDENNIYLSTSSGSQITIQNSDNLSSAVWTSDGGRYRYNRSSNSWQIA